MSAPIRTLRRAPARIIASVLAIALAIGAIGVFAVPDVAVDSLREAAAEDRLAHIAADTTPVEDASSLAFPGADAVEGRISRTVTTTEGTVRLVGLDPADQSVNIVTADAGRLPGAGEALVSDGFADLGDRVTLADTTLEVVGIGTTSWWSEDDAVFTDLDTARAVTGAVGVNRILVRMDEAGADALNHGVDQLRAALAAEGATYRGFPTTVPGGQAPIEADLREISSMIGLLGMVAGLVAMVLLAGTTSTLIAERTREVAVMRALGGRQGPLRRRLRALALGIALAGALIGIALGVVLANLLARMILTRFVGVTPDLAVSWPVVAASLAFALGGAWIVSTRAVRRVTRLPLAEALRDRQGAPFGRRGSERLLARARFGGLLHRMAVRTSAHRRSRALSVTLQLAAGVAAVVMVASLGSSVAAFTGSQLEAWRWETAAFAADPGLPFDAALADGDDGTEAFITELADIDGWEVDLYGLDPDTAMLDTDVQSGSWLDDRRGVVVAGGLANALGVGIGDDVEIDLASGTESYEVVGLHPSRSRDLYLPRQVLADDLGSPGRANGFWSTRPADQVDIEPTGAVDVATVEGAWAEEVAGRDLIIDIFWAIGAVVIGVSLLGVSSSLAVNIYERRHEMAALVALGGRKGHLRLLLLSELVPLARIGTALGTFAGWHCARFIIGFFESSNAVEIGTQLAVGAIPVAALGALAAVTLIAVLAARRAARRPLAATLRGAA
jgi:putative ABC transport system permease protein